MLRLLGWTIHSSTSVQSDAGFKEPIFTHSPHQPTGKYYGNVCVEKSIQSAIHYFQSMSTVAVSIVQKKSWNWSAAQKDENCWCYLLSFCFSPSHRVTLHGWGINHSAADETFDIWSLDSHSNSSANTSTHIHTHAHTHTLNAAFEFAQSELAKER